ncbi:cysteine and glycine-rich protein 3 [Favolaschia claudopus]|uniref:Cysteine and glycine-rich protein 3 n=1 Tax=Favolaschia claudopus TaxID=2862362 RepID=A0AAW0DUG4_9AGAR
MASFGGSAICPRCNKSVYAAEQVLGPGRKFYHKPCLSCTTCKKRLDSLSLLEHDHERVAFFLLCAYLTLCLAPYSKLCHAKNFGTHHIPHRPDPPVTPPRKRPVDNTASDSPSPLSEKTPSLTHSGRFGVEALPRTVQLSPTRASAPDPSNGTESEPSLVLSPEADETDPIFDLTTLGYSSRAMAPVAERYASAAMVQRRHMTGDGESPPRPIARTLTGGSPSPRRFAADSPKCARCAKSVFFAEQVKAANKIYHKPCLRCTSCDTRLDSNRLRDHDGEPILRMEGDPITSSFAFAGCISSI